MVKKSKSGNFLIYGKCTEIKLKRKGNSISAYDVNKGYSGAFYNKKTKKIWGATAYYGPLWKLAGIRSHKKAWGKECR